MAINYELINKGGISLGTNFELLSEKPLDSRLVVPSLDGLQNYIDSAAAYEGMIAYVSSEKKHYEVKVIDGVLSYRPFGLTETELNDLITNATTAAMEFKGATATLPENPAKGDMYKVAGENIDIKIDDVDAKLGDSIVYDGENWFLIPSGDDIEDTWRPVDGVNNDATLKFVDGDKTVAAVAADGTIKYNHATVAAPKDITDAEAGDLNTRTYITAVETDGYGHITGYKTATENVEDTNTEYAFESQVESSSVYFNVTPSTEDATAETIYVDAYSKNETNVELAKKLDKETYEAYIAGKEMSDADLKKHAEDYADSLADNYAATEHEHTVADITDFDTKVKEYGYATTGEVADAKAGAEAKAAELDAALKSELQAEIDADVKVVNDAFEAYKTSNDSALAGVKATAEAAATKAYTDEELAKKVDKVDGKSLVDDAEITKLAGVSAGANKVEASENGKIKIDGVDTVVYTHPEKHTIAEVDGLQDALDGKQAVGDYATKAEAQGYADAKDEAIAAAKKAGDDAQSAFNTFVGTVFGPANEQINTNKTDIANLTTRVGTAEGDIEALETYVGTIPTDEKYADITNVISYINKKAEETLAAASGNSTETAASVKQQLDNYKSENDTRVKAAEDAIDAIEADYLKAADKTELSNAITAEKERAEGIEGGLRTDVDAIKADYLKASDKTELQGNIDTVAGAVELLTNGVDAEKVDGVNDLIKYVEEHGAEVTGMKADIAANTKAITDHETLAAATYETKEDAAAKVVAANTYTNQVKAAVIGTADDASTADTIYGAKKYAEEKASAAETAAKSHADGLNTAMDTRVKVLEEIDHEAYKTADVAILAEAQTYAEGQKDLAITAAQNLDNEVKRVLVGTQVEASSSDDSIWGAKKYAEYQRASAEAYADEQVLYIEEEVIAPLAQTVADNATAAGNAVSALEEKVYTKTEVDAIVAEACSWGSF